MSGLAKPKIKQSNVKLDTQKFAFSMDIEFKLTGVIDVDLDLEIRGALVDNSFAVTIRSTNKPKYEQSIVRDLNVVAVVIPHASDIYMDVFVNLSLYKFGDLVDKTIEKQVQTFMGSGIKSMVDSAMQL